MSVVSYRPKESEDGYFMVLASPELKAAAAQSVPKTVVIVVDRSGSMSGQKIEQARDAVKFLVQQLKPADTFNIIAYDSDVDVFRAELQRVTTDTVNAALSFANGINAGGGTNIDSALTLALKMLVDAKRPNYVLFLTDGQPTVGEQDELKIAANAKAADKVHARIFNLGIGYDVNARLLDRLSHDLGGQSVYVRPNENIETYVATLARSISSPVLTDVDVKFEFDTPQAADAAPSVSRTYPRRLTDLFAGEQLVWVGRYRKAGAVKVVLSGLLGQTHESFDFKADLAERSVGDSNGYVAKVWATRRIGELIDEIDLHGQNSELVSELVELSKKHGIMTPYTSFLADERVNIADRDSVRLRATESLDDLNGQSGGEQGVAQRRFKGNLQAASRPAAPTWTGSDITDAGGQRFGGMGGGMGGMGGGDMPERWAVAWVAVDLVEAAWVVEWVAAWVACAAKVMQNSPTPISTKCRPNRITALEPRIENPPPRWQNKLTRTRTVRSRRRIPSRQSATRRSIGRTTAGEIPMSRPRVKSTRSGSRRSAASTSRWPPNLTASSPSICLWRARS